MGTFKSFLKSQKDKTNLLDRIVELSIKLSTENKIDAETALNMAIQQISDEETVEIQKQLASFHLQALDIVREKTKHRPNKFD